MANKPKSMRVDDNIWKEFNEVADKNCLNKTKWIEQKMREYIKENKEG